MPIPNLSGIADPGPSKEPTRTSPWSEDKQGGALSASVLEMLNEEQTVLEPAVQETPQEPRASSAPLIADVGFDKGKDMPTEEIDVDSYIKPEWEEVADAASKKAVERFGTNRSSELVTKQPSKSWADSLEPLAPSDRAGEKEDGVTQPGKPLEDSELPTRQKNERLKPNLERADTVPPPPKSRSIEAIPKAAKKKPIEASTKPKLGGLSDLPPTDLPAPKRPTNLPSFGPPLASDLLDKPIAAQPKAILGEASISRVSLPEEEVEDAVIPSDLDQSGVDGDVTHFAPGELAGPLPLEEESVDRKLEPAPVVGLEEESNPDLRTMAAPGELAGLLAKTETSPGGTIAAPGELAGLVADLGVDRPIDQTAPEPEVGFKEQSDKEELGLEQRAERLQNLPQEKITAHEAKLSTTDPPSTPPPLDETQSINTPEEESLPNFQVSPVIDPPSDELDIAHTKRLPPLEELIGAGEVSYQLAPSFHRVAGVLLDALVIGLLIGGSLILGIFGEAIGKATWIDPDDIGTLLVQGELTIPIVCTFLLFIISSALGHLLVGRTPGKLAFGLELIDKKTGKRPTAGRAVARAFLAALSVLLGGAGYFWLLVDRRSRTLHDLISGTRVVVASSRRESLPPPEFLNEATL